MIYLVGASRIFTTLIYPLFSPLIGKTRKRLRFLHDEGLHVLYDVVDREAVPVVFGGACECEGGCLSRAVGGREINYKRLAKQTRAPADGGFSLARAALGADESNADFFAEHSDSDETEDDGEEEDGGGAAAAGGGAPDEARAPPRSRQYSSHSGRGH